MTTPSTERKAGPLLGTGAQTAWPFTFKVFAETDIAVTIATSLGVETALVYGTDYSVTLNANQETSPGGTVNYPISGTPLPVGSRLVIVGNLPYDQPLDLPSGGNFSPLALENELDRLTMQIQQLREQVGRALQTSVTTEAGVTLPAPSANELIGWDSTGAVLQNFAVSELATAVAYATMRYDTFAGDGVETEFALTADPVVIANLDVSISGVVQVPGTDYTLVSGSVVFTSAPPNGSAILARYGEGLPNVGGDSNDIRFLPAGAGAVSRTAQSKMRDVVHLNDFGADGTQVGDSAALKAAIAYATTNWLPIILPARRIYWDGTVITQDKVRLWGSGMPALSSGKTALEGGTIIQGALQLLGDYIDLRDFGVDIGSASGVTTADAIKCLAQPYNTGKTLHTENLIGLCDSPSSAVHALLFEGYAQHTGGNLHGVYGYFGVVIKNRNVRLTALKATDTSDTGVYFKSDNVYGQCSDVQVDTIEVVGATAGAVDYAVRLQADSALMDNIQIDKIRAQGHGTSLLVQTLNFAGASFGSAHIGSIISEGAAADDVFIYNLKPGGELNCVEIGSIISVNPAAKTLNLVCESSAEIDNVRVNSIYASYANGTAGAVLNGAVFVGGGVLRSQIGSASLLVAHGTADLGALNYAGAGGKHLLGMRVARVIGPGQPVPGYSVQTLSGSTATVVVPNNNAGTHTSLVKLTHTAPITITTFAPEIANDEAPEIGHIFTLFNASSHNVTVSNNGAGNILNPGYANVTIGENEVRAWVYGDDGVWRGLP